MSRARSALQALRIRSPDPDDSGSAPDNVLEWVLSKWAEQQRRTELPVTGFSMWPVLRSGERIMVRHGGRLPEVGQVVVFLQGERTIAHRVIRRRGDGADFAIRAKGDCSLVADPGWLDPASIVGVVEAVVRDGRARGRAGLSGPLAAGIARLSTLLGYLAEPIHRLRVRRARGAGDTA